MASGSWRPTEAQKRRILAYVDNPDSDWDAVRYLIEILIRGKPEDFVEPLQRRLNVQHLSVEERRWIANLVVSVSTERYRNAWVALLDVRDDPHAWCRSWGAAEILTRA